MSVSAWDVGWVPLAQLVIVRLSVRLSFHIISSHFLLLRSFRCHLLLLRSFRTRTRTRTNRRTSSPVASRPCACACACAFGAALACCGRRWRRRWHLEFLRRRRQKPPSGFRPASDPHYFSACPCQCQCPCPQLAVVRTVFRILESSLSRILARLRISRPAHLSFPVTVT